MGVIISSDETVDRNPRVHHPCPVYRTTGKKNTETKNDKQAPRHNWLSSADPRDATLGPLCVACGGKQKEAIRGRLGEEAGSQGVDGRRLVWAKRVPKSEHLVRHAAADLCLDTLVYGAHSTATDALAGGLPFLTLAGACVCVCVHAASSRRVRQRTLGRLVLCSM